MYLSRLDSPVPGDPTTALAAAATRAATWSGDEPGPTDVLCRGIIRRGDDGVETEVLGETFAELGVGGEVEERTSPAAPSAVCQQ